MANRRNRYKDFDRLMTLVLGADGILFLMYLFFSGFGVTGGKWICAILCILISGASGAYLYLTQEWTRRRSLWMTVSCAAVLLCVLVSLIANYPSPNPLKQKEQTPAGSSSSTDGSSQDGSAYCISDSFCI